MLQDEQLQWLMVNGQRTEELAIPVPALEGLNQKAFITLRQIA